VSKNSWATLLIITIFLLLSGCSGQSEFAQKPDQQKNQRAELPSEFKKIISSTEEIILQTDEKWKMRQPSLLRKSTPIQPQEGQQNGQGGQSGQSGEKQQSENQSSEGQGQGGQQDNQQSQQNQSGSTTERQASWEKETKSLMEIHENWTTLQAQAMQAGMNNSIKNQFDEALDKLTAEINTENDIESLVAAVNLYGQFAEIARLFEDELPPTFYDAKYQVMLVTAWGQQGEWDLAQIQSEGMLDEWDTLKHQSDKAEKSTVSCVEIAIQDLARAVKNNSRELVIIKGEIAVKEITKLQEELSQKKMTSQ
jgi:hypothetical protein